MGAVNCNPPYDQCPCGPMPSMADYLARGLTQAQWQADVYAWNNCVNAAQNPAIACPAGYHFEGTAAGINAGSGCVPDSAPGSTPVSQSGATFAAAARASANYVSTSASPVTTPAPAVSVPAAAAAAPVSLPAPVSVPAAAAAAPPAAGTCPAGSYLDSGGQCAPYDLGGGSPYVLSAYDPSSIASAAPAVSSFLSLSLFGIPAWLLAAGAALFIFGGRD